MKHKLLDFPKFLLLLFLLAGSSGKVWSQVSLTGPSYTENFDGIGTSLPSGWTVRTGATASSLGTDAILTIAKTNWNNTAGAFKNFASADTPDAATQSISTDRALGVRQTGSLGDPGAAFVLQLANTTALTNFDLKFKLQSLDVSSPRTAIWLVQYGIGETPASFTTVTTIPPSLTTGGSSFSNTGVTVDFGTALNNVSQPVWIRIVTLSATTGSGNRPSSAIDDFALTYSSGNAATPVISVASVTKEEGNSGDQNYDFTVTLSKPSTTPVTFNIATADGTATATNGNDYTAKSIIAQTIPAGSTAYTFTVQVTGDNQPEENESFTVNLSNITGATAGDITATGTITNDDGVAITPIYAIQGSGPESLLKGQKVTTTGVVVGDYQSDTSLKGFYIQDAAGDNNTATSDGIFVYAPSSAQVAVGQIVQVSGMVAETYGLTQISNVTNITIQPGTAPVVPTEVTLPVSTTNGLEQYEGMLVKFSQKLTVSQNYTLARYGEVWLSADLDYPFEEVDGRLYNPTNFIDPTDTPATGVENDENNKAAVTAQQDLHNRASILLDDASSVQNPSTVPYVGQDNTLRVGSTIANLTGILSYDFNVYRVQPIATQAPVFTYAPRPLAPPAVGTANVKIASFNVLNYFNGNSTGGGFPTSRGADTPAEFTRQRTKIIAAIKGLDADVVGLLEIENDGDGTASAIADLVRGLNEATSAGTYDYIRDPANGGTGTDAIKVAFIYKAGVVTPVGAAIADMNAVHNRPPLAQVFRLNTTGATVTAVINHFKSKGGTGIGLDADQGDGQGSFNNTRVNQANALVNFINATVIPAAAGDADVIILGDLNAYNEEDPIDVLRAAGFVNLFGPESYSYVFDGQSGSLDHAMVSPSLFQQFTSGGKWHINADEPIFLDYNTEFKTPAQISDSYKPDPFKSSDHDPVLAGFYLAPPTISFATATATTKEGTGSYTVTLTSSFALVVDQTLTITINDYDFQYGASKDYITNPSGATGSFTLTLPAGQTTASFIITPDKNLVSKKNSLQSIDFTISSVSGGLTIGTQQTFSLAIADKKDVTALQISTYPNPVTTQATVKVENAGTGEATISLYDLAGMPVLSKKVNTTSNYVESAIEVGQLQRGHYVLIVTMPNGTIRTHLLLQ